MAGSARARPEPDAGVILLGAGSGSRMGGVNKVFLQLQGRPVLDHSLAVFEASPRVSGIVLVLSESSLEEGRLLVERGGYAKVAAVVPGGERRQDSVRRGLDAMRATGRVPQWVMVHDGARPFVSDDLILRGLDAVERTGAAVPGVPVTDTLKRVDGESLVVETPDRAGFRAVQTPQVFRLETLLEAHRSVSADVTDDAAMVEAMGVLVAVFEGDPENIKLTTLADVERAETIAARRAGATAVPGYRWGTGFDAHRLAAGGPLRLGGVEIEFDHHLEGHSDGDVLLHAVASALLGAAGLGDLGSHFPSSDRSLVGIASIRLLRAVKQMTEAAGWDVVHLDATIVAQRPRLSPHAARVRASIAEGLGVAEEVVNVKITSTDHVGAIGQGEGIAAQATVTLSGRTAARP